jgi:hypothetical protein
MTNNIQLQPRRRLWKKVLFRGGFALVLLLVILGFLPVIMNLFSPDISATDDSDLRSATTKVPDQDNAYFDLMQANKTSMSQEDRGKLTQLETSLRTKSGWDDKTAEELSQRYAASLSKLADAAGKQQIQYPVQGLDPQVFLEDLKKYCSDEKVSEFEKSGVCKEGNGPQAVGAYMWASIMFVKNTSAWLRLNGIRATFHARQGQEKTAMDELLISLRVSELLQSPQTSSPLISSLVFSAQKSAILMSIKDLLSTSKSDSAALKSYSEVLGKHYALSGALAETVKAAYRKYADYFIPEMPKQGFPLLTGYHYKANKTKLLAAEFTREQIKIAAKPCNEELKRQDVHQISPDGWLSFYFTENALGKQIYDGFAAVMRSNMISIRQSQCRGDFILAATQAMIGIKAFKNDKGNLPATLDELVPTYLSSVPVDPFTARPILYSKEKMEFSTSSKDLTEKDRVIKIPENL